MWGFTEYEYYRGKTSELVEKIEIIQNACKHYGFDFSEMLSGFLNSEHFDLESEKVERDSDTTVVVNVGFVFNLHDIGKPANTADVEVTKGYFEGAADEIIHKGIQSILSDSEAMQLCGKYTLPDSITFGNTQIFYFDGGDKHD